MELFPIDAEPSSLYAATQKPDPAHCPEIYETPAVETFELNEMSTAILGTEKSYGDYCRSSAGLEKDWYSCRLCASVCEAAGAKSLEEVLGNENSPAYEVEELSGSFLCVLLEGSLPDF